MRFGLDKFIFVVRHGCIRCGHYLGTIPILADLFDSLEGDLSLSWAMADEAAASLFFNESRQLCTLVDDFLVSG